MSKPRSLFGPLLLIAVGALWLLTKSGNVPSANLWALTHVWPYVLIAAGLGLILRNYWQYANLLMDVVIIGGVVGAVIFAPSFGWDNPSVTTFVFDEHNGFVGPGEPGSGNVITQTRNVDDFQSIDLGYPAQVFITQGSTVSVKVEADDNLLPGLITRVRNGTLEIFYKPEDNIRVNPSKAVKVMIVVKDLDDVHFDTAGDIEIDGVETDELQLSVSGAGNLKLANIDVNGLSIDLSGAGNVVASGDADDFKLGISGFGSFNGKDLHTKTADVEMSGAGSATVWVDDELDAQISGAGSINYYGSPSVSKQVSGVGSISRSGDK